MPVSIGQLAAYVNVPGTGFTFLPADPGDLLRKALLDVSTSVDANRTYNSREGQEPSNGRVLSIAEFDINGRDESMREGLVYCISVSFTIEPGAGDVPWPLAQVERYLESNMRTLLADLKRYRAGAPAGPEFVRMAESALKQAAVMIADDVAKIAPPAEVKPTPPAKPKLEAVTQPARLSPPHESGQPLQASSIERELIAFKKELRSLGRSQSLLVFLNVLVVLLCLINLVRRAPGPSAMSARPSRASSLSLPPVPETAQPVPRFPAPAARPGIAAARAH